MSYESVVLEDPGAANRGAPSYLHDSDVSARPVLSNISSVLPMTKANEKNGESSTKF